MDTALEKLAKLHCRIKCFLTLRDMLKKLSPTNLEKAESEKRIEGDSVKMLRSPVFSQN